MGNNKINSIKLFQDKQVRSVWDDEKERWYFSVVDVIAVLTDSDKPRDYWYRLKRRVYERERIQLSTNCRQLRMLSPNGKYYDADCADTQGILRIIQSVPSKKAEPFKQWLAVVGAERIEEIQNPEIAAQRMHKLYREKGYSEAWIEQRERGIVTRNLLTDEWKERGAHEGIEYAILTNEIYKAGFGMDAKGYKDFKEISKQDNLRDSMTNLELALTNLGEAAATELHKTNDSYGMKELKEDMNEAGKSVKVARNRIEKSLGHPVVSKLNASDLREQKKLDK